MVSAVDIPSPEDTMSLCTESIHVFRELTVEHDLPFPRIFGFPSVREVDTEDIEDIYWFYSPLIKSPFSEGILRRMKVRGILF